MKGKCSKCNISKKILSFVMMFGLYTIISCTGDFEELNTNINEPDQVPTSYLLTYSERELADNLYNSEWNGRLGMLYAQYWSQTAYTEPSRYEPRLEEINVAWNNFYLILMNLHRIIELNTNDETRAYSANFGYPDNQIAVARILKAFIFSFMTDTWGDIPYSEALLGTEVSKPVYSYQKDIYDNLLKELQEAQAQINISQNSIQGDIIYGGDLHLWRKFANSLRMRIALRATKNTSSYISHIKDAITDGAFESYKDNATYIFDNVAPGYNPMYEEYFVKGRSDYACSNTLIETLKKKSDPRILYYADPAVNSGEFEGLTYGLGSTEAAIVAGEAGANVSLPNTTYIIGATSPAIFMGYAEVCFIKAELNLGEGTQIEYEKGIKASMQFYGINEAKIAEYISDNNEANTLNIGIQKWLALYPQGLQAWFEWRRTGYPELQPPVDGALGNTGDRPIPSRLYYPHGETGLNQENYNKAIQRQGPDLLTTRVWWDIE